MTKLQARLIRTALVVSFLASTLSAQQASSKPGTPSKAPSPQLVEAFQTLANEGHPVPADAFLVEGRLNGQMGMTSPKKPGEDFPEGKSKKVTVDVEAHKKFYPFLGHVGLVTMLKNVLRHEYEHCEGPDSGFGITAQGIVVDCRECRILHRDAARLCVAIEQAVGAGNTSLCKELCRAYKKFVEGHNKDIGTLGDAERGWKNCLSATPPGEQPPPPCAMNGAPMGKLPTTCHACADCP